MSNQAHYARLRAMPSKIEETIRLFLFGSFELKVKDRTVHLPTRKTESILAYLALHRSVQNREKIASMFWGDSPDELARRSLRTALSALRKEIGEEFIVTDRETVQLNPDFPLWVDVYEAEKQAKDTFSSNSQAVVNPDLYRGDLLQDFYDDWVLEEREHYRSLFVNRLLQFAQLLRTNGDYTRVISVAQKIISIDSVNERAYQDLIFCYGVLGDRSAALKSYEECAFQLQEKLGVQPSDETNTLFEHVKKSNTSGASVNLVKSNLPIPLTSFIGREQELKTLKDIFNKTRLLTLTGVGGCGKTRLSIELAAQISDQFAEGVWWVELAAIQDEALVPQTIRRTLGLSESQVDSAEESIVKFLQSKQTLLVLDNCEHVVHASARLAEKILSQCPSAKILATSREALSIPGEIAWLVPSLSLPPSDQTKNLLKWECPRLFFERATSYRSDFQLTDSNVEPFLRICRALEGIPLAIELAAARVKTLSLEQLASRLDDKLGLLTTGSRVAQPRQQTLRATIDWSYELLSTQEQRVLQRLSVFYGNWTLEAAEYVCTDEQIEPSHILDLITHLLDKSLIISEDQEGTLRYRMLEIIRQYAMEQLRQADEVKQVNDRHTRYYSELAQGVGSAWYSREQSTLLKQFDAHYPNLRMALTWGLENPKRMENWEWGLRLAVAFVPLWNFRAELNEAQYWLKKVIDQINAVLTEADLEPVKRMDLLSIKAKAIYEMGALSYYLTHHAATMDLFEEAAKIYREIGDVAGLAYPNLYIAQTASETGQTDVARRIWTQSLEQFNQIGDRWYAAMVHSFFGSAERRRGNYDEAEREFHQAIDLYDEIGDEWGRTIMFSHLGMVALGKGDPSKARDWFEQRLRIAQRIGFRHSVAYSTFLIGLTHWTAGDYNQMETCFLESMPYFYEIGNYATLSDCLVGLAWMAAEAGQFEQAAYLLGAADTIDQTFGRKVYFEYDFFNQPVSTDLHSRLDQEYRDAIERGRNAKLDEIVRGLVQK